MINTCSSLKKDLINIGLKNSDVVMLHTSIKAIGELVGGPDIIIDSIMEVIGSDGTLMMYVGWEDSPYHLSEWTSEKQKAYLEELPAFQVNNSRSKRDHGILAEFLRTTKNAQRSGNPGASFVALGKNAKYIIKNHPLNYGYGVGSPLEKLCKLNGKVLLLGSNLAHVTLYHYSESICNLPNKKVIKWKCPVIKENKKTWIEIEEFDTSNGIVNFNEDYFPLITKDYIKINSVASSNVGNALSYLFNANDLNGFAVKWLENKFNTK